MPIRLALLSLTLALAACSGDRGGAGDNLASTAAGGPVGADNAGAVASDGNEGADVAAASTAWPASLRPFGDGYPAAGDPCRRVGESPSTSDYLDDSADLVGCPSDEAAAALKGKALATVDGIRLVSIPRRSTAASANAAIPVRGKGSLEEKCLARVAEITRAPLIGVNRINEARDPIEIFVNVEGAQAPWLCQARRDGTLGRVEYSGSESAA